MKTLLGILAIAFLSAAATAGNEAEDHPFLQTESWWNLYFTKDDNPLQRGSGSIHAVKIVEVNERHPSWIRISFPMNRDDHFSIFGAVVKANEDDDLSIDEALAEWEATISEWRTIWVNLHFVVSMTKVEP